MRRIGRLPDRDESAPHANSRDRSSHPALVPAPCPRGDHPRAERRIQPDNVGPGDAAQRQCRRRRVSHFGAAVREPQEYYALWSLAPALVAIGLAVITQQVVPSLALGILTAAAMLCWIGGDHNPINWVIYALRHYLLGVFIPADQTDLKRLSSGYNHLHVIVFTQFIGGMIGIIETNGGTRAMVAKVTHLMKSRRSGQLGALGGGILIFFDDYANALILGPAMRPVFDRLRLSRAKLAYIVDSTAAPVASLFIGTWLAAEIDFLNTAINGLGDTRPAFMEGLDGGGAFLASLPYRTYAWLALFFVFIVALTGRDFGPMRKAEAEATAGSGSSGDVDNTSKDDEGRYWYLGFFPVFLLVAMTIALLFVTGAQGCEKEGITLTSGSIGAFFTNIMILLGKADSYTALLYSGLSAAVLAAVMSVFSRKLSLAKTMEGMTGGMQRIFGAQIVLILAWGISTATQDLQLGEAATAFLQAKVASGHFAVPMLPTVIFLTAAIVSFSTGTSWGTMGILCPTTVAIAANLLAPLPVEQAMPLFYASIGAVLTGAVFGDHCSPISDTTVLSAMASECDLPLHVRTQLPYAFITAVIGLLCTDILDFYLIRSYPTFYNSTWNVYFGTALAAAILAVIILLIGRKTAVIPREPARRLDV